jgi:cytoskeletal protein RodZ
MGGSAAMFEIGNSLREARLRQQLDFPQVEQATKIRGKYLRALEDEQFDVLPSQTYVKGFLRNYAEFLGLDGQLYVDEYNSRYVVDQEDLVRPRRSSPRTRTRQQRRFESRVVLLALLGIVAVTALVIVAWKFGGGDRATLLPTVTGSTGTVAQQPPPAPPDTAHLVVRAVRGSSLVEVRTGSSRGRVLFVGTLNKGEPAHSFTAKRLWIQVASPEVLRVILNNRTIPLRRGAPLVAVVTKNGVRAAAR